MEEIRSNSSYSDHICWVFVLMDCSSWYICLVIAALLGVAKSNAWTVAYIISLIINIVVMETMTIFIQILATPYIKTNIDSGKYVSILIVV